MTEPNNGNPEWARLIHEVDQSGAAYPDLRATNRAAFEASVRRNNPGDEAEVQKQLAWFDQFRSHIDGAVNTYAAGPDTVVPQPRPAPAPTVEHDDEGGGSARETLHVHRTRFEYETAPDKPAPDRATRVFHSPAVYVKAVVIAVVWGGLVWAGITAPLAGVFGAPWWGWWPAVVTVPPAALVFLWWIGASFRDIRHWIVYGGPRPLRRSAPWRIR